MKERIIEHLLILARNTAAAQATINFYLPVVFLLGIIFAVLFLYVVVVHSYYYTKQRKREDKHEEWLINYKKRSKE